MKIEIREDSVRIDGYVNAVERESKVLSGILHGKPRKFVEKIKEGTFERALERAKRENREVKVLLNHDYDKELANTKMRGTKLVEDAIGLRCVTEIRDKDAVNLAKQKKISGWSFGFHCLKDNLENGDNDIVHREVRDIDLKEVSLLDNTRRPAYDGTSVEVRETKDEYVEIRCMTDKIEIEDFTENRNQENTVSKDMMEYERIYLETMEF